MSVNNLYPAAKENHQFVNVVEHFMGRCTGHMWNLNSNMRLQLLSRRPRVYIRKDQKILYRWIPTRYFLEKTKLDDIENHEKMMRFSLKPLKPLYK